MIKYLNKNGGSGVSAYEIGDDYIRVMFNNNSIYLYTNKSAGKEAIYEMKKLATNGLGLATFISQAVKDNYAVKEQ